MFLKIRKRIERELALYTRNIDKTYSLNKLSPLLFDRIKEFISRDGKRIRPILFCIGYLGFAEKEAPGLYRSALSLELLHDFMLVHDDIIDKSAMRRGKPSMHTLLGRCFRNGRNIKFSGQDLAIIVGDVMYAMALDAFLAVKEKPGRKEAALKKLISAALYTGSGEFIELILGAKPIEKITKNDIYKIYDYKTANYTFASPLTMGALLAGAGKNDIKMLFDYGMRLGRAFQVKDDIIGLFSKDTEIGKSNLTDIAEAKRTLLIWYAYNHSSRKNKEIIKKVFSGKNTGKEELLEIRKIILESASLEFAKKEIKRLINQAEGSIRSLKMRKDSYGALLGFTQRILSV